MKSSIFQRIFVLCLALSISIPISLINVEKAYARFGGIQISVNGGSNWTTIADGYSADVSVESVRVKYDYYRICKDYPSHNGDEISCAVGGGTADRDLLIVEYALNGGGNTLDLSIGEDYYSITITRSAPVAPTVTTVNASNIETVSATVSGKLDSNGGSDITDMGIVYSADAAASLEIITDTTMPYETNDLASVENYSINLTGLAPGVKYYYRAFATNSIDTSYGDKKEFTTSTLKPTITSIADVTTYKNDSTAPLEFTIGDPQYEDGGEYTYASVETSYTHDNSNLVNGEGITINGTGQVRTITVEPNMNKIGEVNITITVKNQSNDTATTNFKVTVLDAALIATTTSVADITGTSAVVHASAADPASIGIGERGVVYSTTNQEPTYEEDTAVADGATTPGDYSVSLSDLDRNTTYYVRAFARNEDGPVYGAVQTFTTLPQLTAFSFTSPTNVDGTINESAKTVAITVPFGTNLEHVIASFNIIGKSVFVGSTKQTSGESENDYTNPLAITVYAVDDTTTVVYTVTVTVEPEVFPLVATTTTVDSITGTSAVIHGSLTDESGVGISERGVVYSKTNHVPTIGDSKATDVATTPGDYSVSLSDLDRNTTYYVRAFARNEDGPVYGAVQTFTTLPQLTAFSFTTPAAIGTINEATKSVAITVPFNTDVTKLIASFSILGEYLYVGEFAQATGETENNFTNPVVYRVMAIDGNTFVDYTITVTVAARIVDETPTPSTPLPAPTKQIIVVDVEDSGVTSGGIVSKAEIERTTQPDGTKKDVVQFNLDQAEKTVNSIIAAGSKSASIVIPDTNDEVSEVNVTVPKESSKLVADSKIDLGISTDNVKVMIPNSSLEGFNDDLFFKFIPIKKEAEKQEVKKRASNETIVRIVAGDNEVSIVGRPMTIETNMQSRPVTLVMPLGDVILSEDELKDLGIFIEHSDGTKELLRGILVPFNDEGDLGLQFTVGKFSTFTLVHIDGLAVQEHTAYMRGYTDGTFRAQRSITRAEMAAILSRVIDQRDITEDQVYTDVSPTLWAKSAISKVTTMGLMKGYSNGTFGAEQPVSRAEMAVLIALFSSNPTTPEDGFSDTAGHWAEAAILSAQAAGMMNGYADGTFKPNASLTRAEAVVIMNKVLGRKPLTGVGQLPWSDIASTHWAIIDIAEASVDHSFEAFGEGEQWVVTP